MNPCAVDFNLDVGGDPAAALRRGIDQVIAMRAWLRCRCRHDDRQHGGLRLRRRGGQLAPVVNDPTAHKIGIDPVRHRDGRYRDPRLAALPDHVEFVLQRVGAPPCPVHPNPNDRTRSRCSLLGVHHLHSGHHLRRQSESNQDGTGRTLTKMQRRMAQIEESIARYLTDMDTADRAEPEVAELKKGRLQEKIAALKEQMQRLRMLEAQMLASPDQQLSLTDPDARSMKNRDGGIVGYNVQTAVDAKHHLIVAHEVVTTGIDRDQLTPMAEQARAATGIDDLTVVADRGYFKSGYFKSDQIRQCEQAGITPILPKSLTSNSRADGRFDKQDFIYIAADDEYRCPAGQRAIKRFTTIEHGMTLSKYWSSACPRCPLKAQCTPSPYRRITRWEHEAVLEAMQLRLDRQPEMMRVRRQTVEHPFGTIKCWMGWTHS